MANKLVTCPYDEAHKVKESRLALHITKCRLNNLDAETFTCSFNATHIYPIQEKNYHLMNCPNRYVIDRAITFNSLQKNNPFKGNTAVPSYTASPPIVCDELWDEGNELIEPAPGFVPKPSSGIIEPPALSKPAERRKLYQELHRRTVESENDTSRVTPEVQPKAPIKRQPKAPSEVEKTDYYHLGLGRGRPAAAAAPSRIAANIFTPNSAPQTVATNNVNYSVALSGMSRLGFGRGYLAPTANKNFAEEEFPVLGRGRAVGTKNDIRPGARN